MTTRERRILNGVLMSLIVLCALAMIAASWGAWKALGLRAADLAIPGAVGGAFILLLAAWAWKGNR